MADPIQSFLDGYEQSETQHIPHQHRPVCCCGNEDCAYLKHNQSALDGLERDVSTAARLGKALLVRHESYIADSERERKKMAAHIETVEGEKVALEKKNAAVIEENRTLLDQLESVNLAVAESDAHVANLQATLQSTQKEIQKLTQLTARTEWLEQQLADFERDQATWQASVDAKEESEKSAIRRWQKAERTLASLQDQIERIEREAREEKERHGEIVERMERRHAVERELGSAAGRLKGAAALKNGSNDGGGPNVVSHFVKDILQDNANLQMGIVELRDMLHNSNEEVESLRSQLLLHQPADLEDTTDSAPVQRNDLREELNRANSQELHGHHHYHAPPVAPKAQVQRKPKRKKFGALTPGHFTPPSGSSTPRSSFSYASPTPSAAILQQTAASVPQSMPTRSRLSTQSSSTYHSLLLSSGPSSPQSTTNRTSSIFDRVFSDASLNSSRPTTPDTEDPGSPVFASTNPKRASIGSFRTQSAHVVPRGGISSSSIMPSLDTVLSVEELPPLEEQVLVDSVIPEENEHEWNDASSPVTEADASVTPPMSDEPQVHLQNGSIYPPPLRRAGSHDSLLSVSGMDIHTLKARPSQLLAPYGGRGITSRAVISDTNAHAARPTAMSRPTATSRNMLSGMTTDQRQPTSKPPTGGKKVGGWLFGRWGATPTATTAEVSTTATTSKPDKPGSLSSAMSSDKTPTSGQATPKTAKSRPAGTNQAGSITGFVPEMKTPPQAPVMKTLDTEALRNILNGK